VQWVLWVIAGFFRSKASLVAENLCRRQQLLVLRRQHKRPRLRDTDRRFWILACRWLPHRREPLLIATPATVLRWHRKGWKAYWRWRSRPRGRPGRKPISPDLKALIRRLAAENVLWGQKRIQAELARLGFKVSARTIARHMRGVRRGPPSPSWRTVLKAHAYEIYEALRDDPVIAPRLRSAVAWRALADRRASDRLVRHQLAQVGRRFPVAGFIPLRRVDATKPVLEPADNEGVSIHDGLRETRWRQQYETHADQGRQEAFVSSHRPIPCNVRFASMAAAYAAKSDFAPPDADVRD